MKTFVCLYSLLLLSQADSTKTSETAYRYDGKITEIPAQATQVLGEQWERRAGMVVADFGDLKHLPPETQKVANSLRPAMEAQGVLQTGEFVFGKKDEPANPQPVTLRVFVFKSDVAAQNYWQRKFQQDGWQKRFAVVEGLPGTLDMRSGLGGPKMRVVIKGNVLMTSQQFHESNDYLVVLDYFARQMGVTSSDKAHDRPAQPKEPESAPKGESESNS